MNSKNIAIKEWASALEVSINQNADSSLTKAIRFVELSV